MSLVSHGLPNGATKPSVTLECTAGGTSITMAITAASARSLIEGLFFHQDHKPQIAANGATVGFVRQASVQQTMNQRKAFVVPFLKYRAVVQSATPSSKSRRVSIMMK